MPGLLVTLSEYVEEWINQCLEQAYYSKEIKPYRLALKEISDNSLTLGLISKFCKKKKLYILRSEVFTTVTRTLWCGGRGDEGGHQRFEEHMSPSQLSTDWGSVFLCLLEQHKCRNSEDHNINVLTIVKIQILCIWYMSAHNTCLSILVLSRLQEKSARRSAVRLESLNNSETTGGQTTRGVGWRWEVKSQPYQVLRMQVKFL